MVKEKDTKQTKYVCPNGCKTVRLLNAGVSLALCEKCLVQMVPENFKVRLLKREQSKPAKPYMCDRCGKGRNEGIHVLTVTRDRGCLCHDCI